jgi:hypothetical protein
MSDKAPIQMTRAELLTYIQKDLYSEIESLRARLEDKMSDVEFDRDRYAKVSALTDENTFLRRRVDELQKHVFEMQGRLVRLDTAEGIIEMVRMWGVNHCGFSAASDGIHGTAGDNMLHHIKWGVAEFQQDLSKGSRHEHAQ